jgi:hypothetical protein
MFGIGVSELQVAFLLILLVAVIEWWRLRHAGPNLVLREFRVGSAETAGEFLYILGRRSGIVAWLLTLFGLHPQTSFSQTTKSLAKPSARVVSSTSTRRSLKSVRHGVCTIGPFGCWS